MTRNAEATRQINDFRDRYDREARQNNLLIFGIQEYNRERNWDTLATVQNFLCNYLAMKVDETNINNCYRIGKGRFRPILVKFTSFLMKDTILARGHMLKGTKIRLDNDYDFQTRQERQKLLPLLRSARARGLRAILHFNKIRIEGRIMGYDDANNFIEQQQSYRPQRRNSTTDQHSNQNYAGTLESYPQPAHQPNPQFNSQPQWNRPGSGGHQTFGNLNPHCREFSPTRSSPPIDANRRPSRDQSQQQQNTLDINSPPYNGNFMLRSPQREKQQYYLRSRSRSPDTQQLSSPSRRQSSEASQGASRRTPSPRAQSRSQQTQMVAAGSSSRKTAEGKSANPTSNKNKDIQTTINQEGRLTRNKPAAMKPTQK